MHKTLVPLREVIGSAFTGMVLSRQPSAGPRVSKMKIVTIKDLQDGVLAAKNTLQEHEFADESKILKFMLVPRDIVISARGTVKVAVATADHATCLAGPNLIVIRAGEKLQSDLIFAFLKHPQTQDEIKRLSVGTTVPAINLDSILNLRVVVPPLSEQAQLSKITELAERQYTIGRKILDMRRSLSQELAFKAMSL